MIVGTETDEEIVCPINTVIDIFSRKWVFGILKDMFLGKNISVNLRKTNRN